MRILLRYILVCGHKFRHHLFTKCCRADTSPWIRPPWVKERTYSEQYYLPLSVPSLDLLATRPPRHFSLVSKSKQITLPFKIPYSSSHKSYLLITSLSPSGRPKTCHHITNRHSQKQVRKVFCMIQYCDKMSSTPVRQQQTAFAAKCQFPLLRVQLSVGATIPVDEVHISETKFISLYLPLFFAL